MGGGDLNFKKSWHPQRMHNMEKVWLEEKKAEDEGKRIEQIKKEIEEQRKIEEMEQLQEQAGLKKRSNKLEWMYASGPIHQVMEQEEKESYLLGDKKIDKLLGGDKLIEGGEGLSSGKALDLTNANSIRDTQNKIRDDPLFMIKKMEKQSLEKLLKNPIKLAHLKEKKKEKKEKKKSKSKKHSKDSEDESHEGRSKR
ncbi:hypothetical protein K502DRAFT_297069 [Neoconidiobolus thromboides FSU 785]|nr:hypothetical protein K502DRAFT_297069 [Neoconidiobolus thromboides FSU 785]